MKKSIMLDGGVGRIICTIPAVEEFIKKSKEEVVVITGWLDPYLNNKKPTRVYHMNQSYLWEDVIKSSELLHPEPYWDYQYYNQKHHLIQSFYKGLGLTVPKDIPRPNIMLQDMEIEWAKQLIRGDGKEKGKKVIIFQPYGAGAKMIGGNCNNPNCTHQHGNSEKKVIDESNRSLDLETTEYIMRHLNKDYKVISMSHLMPLTFGNPGSPQPETANMRHWMSIISLADYVIGIDSCAQHIAYAFNKPGFFIYGGTYKENLSYPDHVTWSKPGYPKEYNPIRLPANPMLAIPIYNEGAMNFSPKEREDILQEIKKFLSSSKDK